MMRLLWVLAFVSVLNSACSRTGPPQTAEQAAAEAPAGAAETGSPAPQEASSPAQATSSASQTPEPAGVRAPEPAAPATPQLREVTIPAGTSVSVTLATPVASDTSKVEDPVRGTLARPIVVAGTTVVPAGTEVVGSVVEANQSGRVKGRASIAIQFERLVVRGESHAIRTARVAREAAGTEGEDAKKIGIGAGIGAIVGGIAGGGKGAAIGATVGGGAGTGAVLATRGDEVGLAAGETVSTSLREAVVLLVPAE